LGKGGDGLSLEELKSLVEEEVTEALQDVGLEGGNANVLLYKGYDAKTLPSEEDISVDSTYTFETGTIVETDTNSPDINGWSINLPVTQRYVFLKKVVLHASEPTKTIAPSDWSSSVLAYDRGGVADLDVDIVAPNGNIFRNDVGETEVKAVITADGVEISPSEYTQFDYDWTSGGVPVCVHGTCPIGYGVPATNSGETNNFPNGELKSIFIEAQAVPNSGTLPLQLTINDKQED
jgi:hypothetical protein